MKLFVLSDIHGDIAALDAALVAFERSDASHLLCLGDVLNHGPRNPLPEDYQPLNVAERLNHYSQQIIAVRGNCDSEVDQALCSFPLLGDYSQLLLGKRRVFACHGHNYGVDNLPPLARGDIFISGHTHLALAEHVQGVYLLNPGSIAMPRGERVASYGMLDGNGFAIHCLASHACLLTICFGE